LCFLLTASKKEQSEVSTNRLYRVEGIVIRRRDQGEADRILTLCTPEGKIEVNAKGARKVRSRKAGHVELFARSRFVIARVRNSWDIVSQVEMVTPHAALRSDLLRGAYARYVGELLDRFFAVGEGTPALFDLLNYALEWLCEDSDLDLTTRFYEQHLLSLAGFQPELFRCVGQHEGLVSLPLHDSTRDEARDVHFYGFDPERGGTLCPDCYARQATQPRIVPLSPDGLALLQACRQQPYTQLRTRRIAPALHTEIERAMRHYITYHLERSVKSGAFLSDLKNHLEPQRME